MYFELTIDPPQTFWEWVLVGGAVIGILWFIGFCVVVFIRWATTEPSPQRSSALERATKESHEVQVYKNAIDAIYDRAEDEVRRLKA